MTRYLYCLVLLFGCFYANATHIVGGEVTYRCLGNNQYRIRLTVYRDCYNGVPPFDNPAALGVFRSSDWSLEQNILLPFIKDDTIPVQLSNPCLTVPPDVCVHRTTYETVVTLPFVAGGYTITYQRCCRNMLIRNIPNPEDVGASFIAVIDERALQECNNSAVFRNWPPVAICVNEPIDFDHGANDLDDDSLVYRLCTPLNGASVFDPQPQPPYSGPYEAINWLAPNYSLNNILGGDPLKIDPATGFLTGIPNTLGNFVVGICVDEYRDGEYLSTTRRDFQYNVASCGLPASAFFAPEINCDTLAVQFENLSERSTEFKWFFDWDGDRSKQSTLKSPVFTYNTFGMYTIALIAQPNDPCSDTAFVKIKILQSPPITVTADPATITGGKTSQLNAQYTGSGTPSWSPPETLNDPGIFNPIASPLLTTTYTVIIQDSSGCSPRGTVTVSVLPFLCDENFVFFPSAFSPNGDDENDYLKLESNFVTDVYWAVYNRFGQKVFEATNVNDRWDGTFQGQEQPVETYAFYLRAICAGGKEFVKKGNVTLLR